MQLTCLYHASLPMYVTDDEALYNKLIASGKWFDHPKKVLNPNMEGSKENGLHEEQRLHPTGRKGRGDRKQSSENG